MKPDITIFCSLIVATTVFSACKHKASDTESALRERAHQIAQSTIITDGHIDLPYRMQSAGKFVDVSIRTEDGDFDYVRAKAGGLDAPFMSIYVPSEYQLKPGSAKLLADTLINLVEKIVSTYPDKFALATTTQEVISNTSMGKISLPMGIENGAPVEQNLANVRYFYDRGIRYITLTHGKDNQICDSSYDTTRTWNGLSPFGVEVVAEMNKVGIMVDISHVSDSAFYDVMRVSKAPAIASHSSCRTFTPGFERNMSDEMIQALAKNGGVIQINFGTNFLDGEKSKKIGEARKHLADWVKEKGLNPDDSAAKAYARMYMDTVQPFSTVQKVADHIDHVVKIAGIDHVGLGSDYDGVGDSLPIGLKDVSHYPNLILELLKRGYSEEDIQKICYKNVFRVWDKVAGIAVQLQASAQ